MRFSVRVRTMTLAIVAVSLVSCSVATDPVVPEVIPDSVVGAAVPALDLQGIPGAIPVVMNTDGTAAVRAHWVYLNGAEPYNDHVDARLLEILDQHAGGRYNPSVPDTGKPSMANGLKLDEEVILAGGPMLGTRLTRSTVVNGSTTIISVTTEYTDLSTGTVFGGSALVSAEGVESIRKLLVEAEQPNGQHPEAPAGPVSTAAGSSDAAPSQPATEEPLPADLLLGGAAFNPSGELVIPFTADPVSGVAFTTPHVVHVSARAAAPLLSDAGRQMQQLAGTGQPLTARTPAAAGQEHINCDLLPCAALTYDDGPNTQTTRLLGILAKHSIHATFFQQGVSVASFPAIAAAVAAAGHSIGNHTMNHPYLTKLSAAAITAEVQGASATILQASGQAPTFLRPPYGASNALVKNTVGMPMINWSVDSHDWLSRDKNAFIPTVLNLVRPGAVILQHDIHATTVDGQDQLITALQEKGYHLVTVPQLFHGIELQKGHGYFCRGTESPCTPSR